MIFLYSMCIVIYSIGIWFYIDKITTEIDFHKYFYYYNRDITPKDVRMSILWPILLIFVFVKAIIFIVCEILNFFFFLFGYTGYKNSKFYRFIDKKLFIL